ncbi:MAG TPA: hypothetical protein VLA33_09260 [Gemmatimonadota bacterium]|nr:hypothetical protein [Gemmatimonadota bacterium]
MDHEYFWTWRPSRFSRLRSSSCTRVQVERAARIVYRSWARVCEAKKHLERAKHDWYDDSPRPIVDRGRPFCFVLRRMKRSWRDADRRNDLSGFAVNRTVGASEARRNWSGILNGVISNDQVVRIRHQHADEPAILITEARFRALETGALPDIVHAERISRGRRHDTTAAVLTRVDLSG